MKKFRLSLLVALILCTVLAFAACTDDGQAPDGTSAQDVTTTKNNSSEETQDGETPKEEEDTSVFKIKIYDGTKYIKTVSANENGEYTLEPIAKEGYTFDGFVDESGNAFPQSGTISANCTVNTNFTLADTTTFEQLKARLESGAEEIRLAADITVTDSIFVVGKSTIYAKEDCKLTRSPSFVGDIFVIGETPNGQNIVEVTGIPAALTINATEGGAVTIDGNKQNITDTVNGTALLILNGSEVKLLGDVTIQNCKKLGNEKVLSGYVTANQPHKIGGAAAIVLSGNLVIDGATLADNEVSIVDADKESTEVGISSCGGAIYNYAGLVIESGKISGNKAARGGAIYNYRDVKITGGTIENNYASIYGGAAYLVNSQFTSMHIGTKDENAEKQVEFKNNSSEKSGGAICSQRMATVVVNGNTVFDGNKSLTSNGGAINAAGAVTVYDAQFKNNVAASKGGAIYVYYSDTEEALTEREVNIYAGIFDSNSASKGGAIAASASSAEFAEKNAVVYIGNVSFMDNTAFTTETEDPDIPDGGSSGTFNGNGGALYIARKAEVTIEGATFSGNNAGLLGGAAYFTGESIVVVKNATFTGNSSADKAGAAYVTSSANVTMTNCTFTENTTENYGGAISAHSEAILKAEGCSFTKNKATVKGGAAVSVWSGANVEFKNCDFAENTATTNGGVFYVNEATAAILESELENNAAINSEENNVGGAVYATKSTVTIIESSFNGNSATDKAGAVYATSNSVVTILNSAFTQNTAANYGGAISVHGGAKVTVTGTTFTKNSATVKNGGALSVFIGGSAELEGCTFTENSAAESGGAACIYTDRNSGTEKHAYAKFTNCTFDKNTATDNGGAIYIYTKAETTPDEANPATNASDVVISGGVFTGNIAQEKSGGAIYHNRSTLNISGATFNSNSSAVNGGAIYITSEGDATVTGTTFNKNIATEKGGAVHVTGGGDLDITGSSFNENSAAGGGGLYFEEGALTAENISFEKNSATDGNGGALYLYTDATYTINGLTMISNTASSYGGGIYTSGKAKGDIYGLSAVKNTAAKGGMLYITTSKTTISIHSKGALDGGADAISGNTATDADGGNLIWSNSTGAVINIDFANFPEWKTADGYTSDIAGKLNIAEI